MLKVDNKIINIGLAPDVYKYKIVSLLQNIIIELNSINSNINKVDCLIDQLKKDINEFNNLFNN